MPWSFPIWPSAGPNHKSDSTFGAHAGDNPFAAGKIRGEYCKRCIAAPLKPGQRGSMTSHRVVLVFAVILPTLLLFGSSFGQDLSGPERSTESEGFRFRGGNPQEGRNAFVTLKCIECHSVRNVDLEGPQEEKRINLELALETRFVKRYEDIILAITNPRHVITEQYRKILTEAELRGGIDPLMPDLTKDMSARQLIDLTAFLDEVYARELPDYGRKGAK